VRVAAFGLVLLAALASVNAHAHRFAPSLLRVFEVGDNQFNVIWKTPAQATSPVPLLPVFPASCKTEGGDGGSLEGTGVVTSFRLVCSQGLVGQTIAISGLAENQASVLFSLETRDEYFYQTLLSASQTQFVVPAEPTATQVMAEYLWLGADHIWSGIDHLMFVFGLLLLVGWNKRLVWTITAFTLGHSVTLSLVSLGFLEYPVALVEFAIALSIFVLALNLARRDDSGLFRQYPWWLAGGFGLLHGMGFAGALIEVGLPQAEVPLALLFFNIGIEFGQLTFILVIIAAWHALRSLLRGHEQQLLPVPVYVLGSCSAMWCIERALQVF
jgi:hydrogenase/urease accessory protein HupE